MFRKEAMDRLTTVDDLDELMHVTTPRSWLALLALVSVLAVGFIWGLFVMIPTTVSGRGALTAGTNQMHLTATVYVSPDDGRQIQPGMPVKLALSSVNKQQGGLLLGTVATVDELPSNQERMQRVLGNDMYVQTLATAGQLIPVTVQLIPDGSTPSGYKWSSAQGPATTLREGMVCEGTITVDEQRAIQLVLP